MNICAKLHGNSCCGISVWTKVEDRHHHIQNHTLLHGCRGQSLDLSIAEISYSDVTRQNIIKLGQIQSILWSPLSNQRLSGAISYLNFKITLKMASICFSVCEDNVHLCRPEIKEILGYIKKNTFPLVYKAVEHPDCFITFLLECPPWLHFTNSSLHVWNKAGDTQRHHWWHTVAALQNLAESNVSNSNTRTCLRERTYIWPTGPQRWGNIFCNVYKTFLWGLIPFNRWCIFMCLIKLCIKCKVELT